MPDDEKPEEENVSDESPPGPALPEKPTSEPVPDDIMDVVSSLLGGDEKEKEEDTNEETEGEEKEKRGPGRPAPPVGELLPPREFFEWVLGHKGHKFTKKQKEVLLYLYEHPDLTMSRAAVKGGFNRNHVRKVIQKIQDFYDAYRAEFELEGASLEPEPIDPEPAIVVPPQEKRSPGRPPKRKPAGGNNGTGEDEKLTNKMYELTKATTTFKEVDKTIAKVLGADFHDAAVKKNVYARLGELLIYTLLQLGAIDRDKIVEYSQTLVDDPDALYFYVKEQLDAVIKITDPDTLQRVWMENAQLRMKVMALEATADMLSDALNYYGDTIRALIGLLNKKQLEKFATWIYMSEYMRRIKKKKMGGVSVGGAGSATGRV